MRRAAALGRRRGTVRSAWRWHAAAWGEVEGGVRVT